MNGEQTCEVMGFSFFLGNAACHGNVADGDVSTGYVISFLEDLQHKNEIIPSE